MARRKSMYYMKELNMEKMAVYATRESGSRAGVSADAGGGRKTKENS